MLGRIECGAFTLALVAGSVNAIGLLGFRYHTISHLSGTATLLGAGRFGTPTATLHLLGILVIFVAGAALTGFVIRTQSVRIGRHYHMLLYIEAALLIISIGLLRQESVLAAQLSLSLSNERITLLLHQKLLGKELLITNLRLTPGLLAKARVHLIYGGYDSPHNVTINDFGLWPVEAE